MFIKRTANRFDLVSCVFFSYIFCNSETNSVLYAGQFLCKIFHFMIILRNSFHQIGNSHHRLKSDLGKTSKNLSSQLEKVF